MNVIAIYACILRCGALLMIAEAARLEVVFLAYGSGPARGDPRYSMVYVALTAILAGVQWIYASELSGWVFRAGRSIVSDGLRAGLLVVVFPSAPKALVTGTSYMIHGAESYNSIGFLLSLESLPQSVIPRVTTFALALAVLLLATPIGRFLQSLDRKVVRAELSNK